MPFMEGHFIEWLSLLVRWFHIVVGIAWIGASFYFVWLDNSLRPPEGPAPKGVGGEVWAVHGGGFYHIEKFSVSPERLPTTLHWFKWEAYLTWLSGLGLLSVVYYLSAGTSLVKPGVDWLTPWMAVGIGAGSLVIAWLVYDLMCRSPLGNYPVPFATLGFLFAVGAAFGYTQVFESRAAYIHVGALLGTLMALNVFFVIIPNQKEMVKAMAEDRPRDPQLVEKAKQRSLHNNYMTLPVLFIMVSNHYPFTYGHEWNWAVLAGLAAASVAVRHYINQSEKGRNLYWLLPVAALMILALGVTTRPPVVDAAKSGPPVSFSKEVAPVIKERCASCHSEKPTDDVFRVAPLGTKLDSPEQIKAMIPKIKTRTVDAPTMPLGNKTKMTDAERQLLGRWIAQGAPINN